MKEGHLRVAFFMSYIQRIRMANFCMKQIVYLMQIVETAKIKLVLDGAELGKNQLSEISDKISELKQKRDQYTKGSKEWKEYNDQLREQEKIYKDIQQRIDINSMSLKQLTKYQKELRTEIRELEPGSEAFEKVASRLKEVNQRIVDVNGTFKATSKEVNESEGIWSKAKGWIVGAFSVAAITAFIGKVFDLGKQIFEITSRFEKYETVLKNTLGGQEEAAAAMEMLKELAKTTPIGLDEMTGSFIKMVNRGLQPTSEELKKLADLAASQGKSFDQLTEAVLDAMMGEGERLKEFGIKLRKEGDNVSLMFKGQTVSVKNSEQAIYDAIVAMGAYQGVAGVTGEVSAGLEGRLSNLGDAWDFVQVAIGEKLKPVFQWVLVTLAQIVDWIGENIKLADPYIAVWNNLREALLMVWERFSSVLSIFKIGENRIFTLENFVKALSTSFAIFGSAIKVAVSIVQVLIDSFLVLGNAGKIVFSVLKGDFAAAGRDAISLGNSWNTLKENATKNFDSITGVYKKIWESNSKGMEDATKQVDIYGKMVKATEDKTADEVEKGGKKRTDLRKKEAAEAEKLEKELHQKFLQYEREYLKEVEDGEKKRQKFQQDTNKLIEEGLRHIEKFRNSHFEESENRLKLNTDVINSFYSQQQQDHLKMLAFKSLSSREAEEKENTALRLFGTNYVKLTKEQQDKVNAVIEEKQQKRRELIEKGFLLINSVVDAAMNVYGAIMSDKMDKANSNTERALLENQEMWVQWGTQATSVVQAWMKDWVSGLAATVAWAGQGIANLFNAGKRKRQAELEDLRIYYEEQISRWRDFIEDADADIQEYFGHFMDLTEQAQEYTKALSEYDPQFLIENELKRAKTISDTYDKAVAAEKSYYDQQIKRVNDIYDAEVKRINDIYDLQQKLADQHFSQASNAILRSQADSLMSLISNSDTLESLNNDYRAWYDRIESTFTLANKEITEGMSQAEIDAINAAREAREEARKEALNWLISELEFAVESEGQKRKEYSMTEKIRQEAEMALDELRDQKAMEDIQRNLNRQNELVEQERIKNDSLLQLEAEYNDKILDLTMAKDQAIKDSWDLVKEAVIRGYDDMAQKAKEAYDQGLITLQQYREIVAEINNMNKEMGAGKANIDTPMIDYSIDNNASKNDKRFMQDQGLWAYSWSDAAANAYSEWLRNSGKSDSAENRIDFFMKQGNVSRFAEGSEFVDPEGKFPKGVDAVPGLLMHGEAVLKASLNKEKLDMGLDNEGLIEMARVGVAARNSTLISAFKNSAISQSGMPSFKIKGVNSTKVPDQVANQKIQELLTSIDAKLDKLEELEELKAVKEEIKRKPVVNTSKLQEEASADLDNWNRSTFR